MKNFIIKKILEHGDLNELKSYSLTESNLLAIKNSNIDIITKAKILLEYDKAYLLDNLTIEEQQKLLNSNLDFFDVISIIHNNNGINIDSLITRDNIKDISSKIHCSRRTKNQIRGIAYTITTSKYKYEYEFLNSDYDIIFTRLFSNYFIADNGLFNELYNNENIKEEIDNILFGNQQLIFQTNKKALKRLSSAYSKLPKEVIERLEELNIPSAYNMIGNIKYARNIFDKLLNNTTAREKIFTRNFLVAPNSNPLSDHSKMPEVFRRDINNLKNLKSNEKFAIVYYGELAYDFKNYDSSKTYYGYLEQEIINNMIYLLEKYYTQELHNISTSDLANIILHADYKDRYFIVKKLEAGSIKEFVDNYNKLDYMINDKDINDFNNCKSIIKLMHYEDLIENIKDEVISKDETELLIILSVYPLLSNDIKNIYDINDAIDNPDIVKTNIKEDRKVSPDSNSIKPIFDNYREIIYISEYGTTLKRDCTLVNHQVALINDIKTTFDLSENYAQVLSSNMAFDDACLIATTGIALAVTEGTSLFLYLPNNITKEQKRKLFELISHIDKNTFDKVEVGIIQTTESKQTFQELEQNNKIETNYILYDDGNMIPLNKAIKYLNLKGERKKVEEKIKVIS